jgi:hypothetical protein
VTGPAPAAPVPILPQPTLAPPEPGWSAPTAPPAATEPTAGTTDAEPGPETDREPGPEIEPTTRAPRPAPAPPESERTDDDGEPPGDPFGEGLPPDPFGEGAPPDPFDEGAQPDPFAEATPERPVPASDRASGATGRATVARGSAEALAEAAAGDRLELLRSVFPGRVVRLVPHAAPGAAGGRGPTLDDEDAVPLDTPADPDGVAVDPDADGVGPVPNEPGGST